MCRLLIVTGELKRDQVLALLTRTAYNFAPTQRDGFGFASFNQAGQLTARGQYFDKYTGWRNPRPSSHVKEEGSIGSRTHTLIIHGRTSTNVVGVDYCHPFKFEDTVLAHNGVLTYRGPGKSRPTHKNDSGAFLEWLVKQDHPKLSKWASTWSGYGAIALMRPGRGLSVVKCDRARLTLAPRIGQGYILATSPYDIPDRLRGQDQKPISLGASALDFDPRSGNILNARKFEGFGYQRWDSRAERAMGSREDFSKYYQSTLFDD